ncbi:hypothetical protein M9H77_17270 [Catharanthus roseus]|uniref:Uncharacterized protein n=1 Tax=Catharanthus roseus TaxID=4058 RepID=A0ACC0B4D8_CATRO|nr:hypothetical protein M9H77_17270 [Catharanthus roseus]
MAYSKLARAMSNCYKDGDYGGNAHGRSHLRDGHFTYRSQMGISNFSSHAKTYDHIPCVMVTKSCSFILDLNINSLQHACTSMGERRHNMEFEGRGKNAGGKLFICSGDSSMSFSSNLFLFYLMFSFKELKLSLELNAFYVISVRNCMVNLFTCELVLDVDHMLRKKMNGSLKVFKAHLSDLVKTTYGNDVFDLNLKNLVEKHLVYCIAFIDFLFKYEALNESIVQNIKSCVKIENQSLGTTLLYSLTFKKFLDELNFKRELKFRNSYCVETLVDKLDASFAYPLLSLEYLGNFHSTVPFNASISNVARLLWLFKGMDSRTTPFKRGVYGAQEGAFRGTKILLFFKLQVEEAKETSWEDLEASKPNGVDDLNPIIHGRVMLFSSAICSLFFIFCKENIKEALQKGVGSWEHVILKKA